MFTGSLIFNQMVIINIITNILSLHDKLVQCALQNEEHEAKEEKPPT
jgi:hypothetical protein